MAKSRKKLKKLKKKGDKLERVLRPIVEGQLAAYADAHPVLVDAVDWFKPRLDKRTTFINSGAKRILRDLLSLDTRRRLILAIADQKVAVNAGQEEVVHELGLPQG